MVSLQLHVPIIIARLHEAGLFDDVDQICARRGIRTEVALSRARWREAVAARREVIARLCDEMPMTYAARLLAIDVKSVQRAMWMPKRKVG
jgi:hypothetical protein